MWLGLVLVFTAALCSELESARDFQLGVCRLQGLRGKSSGTGPSKKALLLKRQLLLANRKKRRRKLRSVSQSSSGPLFSVTLRSCRRLGGGIGQRSRLQGARLRCRKRSAELRARRVAARRGVSVCSLFRTRAVETWERQVWPAEETEVETGAGGLRKGRPWWHGGGGGAARTKRERQEALVLSGLQDLLAKLDCLGDEDAREGNTYPPDGQSQRGRSPTPRSCSPGLAAAAAAPSRSRSPSPGWQVKGKGKSGFARGKGKGEGDARGKGPGKGKAGAKGDTPLARSPSFSPHSDRRVVFASGERNSELSHTAEEASILARLKALVLECETQGPGGIIPKLRKLAQSKHGAVETRAKSPGRNGVEHRHQQPPASTTQAPARFPAKSAGKGKQSLTRLSREPRIDAGWWPGRISGASAFDKVLFDGTEPTASLVVASLAQVKCWRELAATHSLQAKVALLCPEVQGTEAPPDLPAVKKWVKTQEGVWKQVWAVPLGAEMPSWGTEPQVVNCEEHLPPEAPCVTVRAIFSKEYMLADDWAHALKKPAGFLRTLLPPELAVRSFGWHHFEGKDETIVGFVRIPSQSAGPFVLTSGHKGAFLMALPEKGTVPKPTPVKWIPNPHKGKSNAYFALVRREAEKAKVGIAFRKGGGANLGLVGVPPEAQSEEGLRRRWAARKVPYSWGPQQLLALLSSCGWRVIKDIQPPAHAKGLWTFMACPPPNSSSDSMMLQCGKAGIIEVLPYRKQETKVFSHPLKVATGWVTKPVDSKPKHSEGSVSSQDGAQAETDQPGPTQLDEAPEEGDATMKEPGTERKEKRGPETAPSEPKSKNPKTEDKPNPILGPDSMPLQDWGGTGDCGLRCLAAANALRHGAGHKDLESKLQKVALSLRVKACNWLDDNQGHWALEWFSDPECNETTEAGKVPTSAAEYMKACRRPNKWLDPFLTAACANILQTEVLVFKWIRGSWKFLERVTPEHCVAPTPLVLCLKDQHFQTIQHGFSHPARWTDLGKEARTGPSQSYLGGVPSKRPDQDASSSCSEWLRPATAGQDPGKPSAPSGLLQAEAEQGWSSPHRGALSAAPSAPSVSSEWLKPYVPDRLSGEGHPAQLRLGRLGKPPEKRLRLLGKQKGFCSLNSVCCAQSSVGRETAASSNQAEWSPENRLRDFDEEDQGREDVKEFSWPCPECGTVLRSVSAGGLSSSKRWHMKSRHPSSDNKHVFVSSRKADAVIATASIPQDQRDWTCPMPNCNKGLPALRYTAYLRAVKKHCETDHPAETPRSLYCRQAKKPKTSKGVSKCQTAKHKKTRALRHRTHDMVSFKSEHDPRQRRGSLVFCRKCLYNLNNPQAETTFTCKRRLALITSEGEFRTKKRQWWLRLKETHPLFAKELLAALGKTQADVDEFLGLSPEDTYASLGYKARRAKRDG